MEEKKFFDVFATLTLTGERQKLFEKVRIRRVSSNKDRTLITVYIVSDYLIQKEDIYFVEKEIQRQCFNGVNIRVKIMEKYRLSAQYTPKKLYAVYKDSIYTELKNTSNIEYNILLKADCTFTDEDTLSLAVEDTVIAREKSEELRRILEKIFVERCGFDTKIYLEYKTIDEDKIKAHEKEKEEIISRASRQAVSQLADNAKKHKQEASEKQEKVSAKENKKNEDKTKKNNDAITNNPGKFNKRFNDNKKAWKPIGRADNPDVIYGRDFEDEVLEIKDVVEEQGEVVIKGKVISLETREIKGDKTIAIFDVTDFTDTITIKLFMKNEKKAEILGEVKTGKFFKIKGYASVDRFDGEITIGSVVGIKKIPDFTSKRVDKALKKRVELHCHTKMSDMDGVTSAGDILQRALEWGHPALAITDHGVVQGFTEAFHAMDKLKGKYENGEDFKVIYGVEAYLVDDLKEVVVNSKNQSINDSFVVFDLETTGKSYKKNKIIEIGAVKIVDGKITDRFSTFVNPNEPIPFKIVELTSITDEMLIDAPQIENVLPEFLEFIGDAVMVAHNADFDMGFLKENCKRLGIEHEFTSVDTVSLARALMPNLNRFKLNTVAKALQIPLLNHHRAVDDAECTAKIYLAFIDMLKERDLTTLDEVNEWTIASDDRIKKMETYHAIILAKNVTGRTNLYRLISNSHLKYYNRRPRIPKSDFIKNREGLILGSACEAGELFKAVLWEKSDEEIARLVNFYDYLEIQPVGNNEFMIRSDDYEPQTIEDLQELNRKIVKLGEEFDKPVVATCDVHFLDPEDEVYRRVIMAGKGFADADMQAPLYLRTTEEMLAEFQYLGSEKAEEIVITNTNKIADSIEKMDPVRPDKCPPVIPDSDKTLRKICYDTAHSMYGENLPEIVTERLERELNSIISNGFAVMYIIAQKLVWKSNEDGYLVGSRGSVGSSFVATMAGITEVNPLSPHYYCAKCHYSDFDSPDVRKYAGGSGCDMPDKDCPECGEKLVKAGFDIPFETFLGFKGNKEPDIDLNFSGEYQNHAHDYTEVIFGKGQTYRAGTIGTLAEKTAFGYVKKYYEERGVRKRKCEITRIAKGCEGIRRSTGQHPGGIIVLPHGEDINSFTPVQHPANDMTTKTITTHFDYHSIDHNLLKLDILGHDDPTMIRMLEDLTQLDAKAIPLDDKKVMSLFADTSALGIEPKDIGGCKLGSIGIPEFGTEFAIQMLIDTKPKTFSDLVRIAGLAHGTDVWIGNAKTLIENGDATISTAICTRDDIMVYLINMGMDKELSFTIMESVRKGKGLKEEWEKAMKEVGVPSWYIWSCKKIKYMFPKAHAAAYVMMAFRIAWFKVYYPLAYYAAFFSIRASAFNYELMCMGRQALDRYIAENQAKTEKRTASDDDTLRDMKVVREMYARGYEFEPIDIYKAKAHRFQIVNGKIMPSLDSLDGLGDKAADQVVEAAKAGKFLSRDDFKNRSKASQKVVDLMNDLGILGNLPKSNQISLFDL